MADEKTNKTTDRIYAVLFDRIVNAEYQNDEWLREEAVAQEFGVSRSPVRNVFRLLHEDGMLELVRNRGARIYPFTADDAEEIYEIRKALEPLALSLGMHNLSIQRLFAIKKQTLALNDEGSDEHEYVRMDGVFHTYLIESSRRRRLVNMISELYRLSQSLRGRGLRDRATQRITVNEHCAILDALITRDLPLASSLLVTHIENSKRRLLADIVQHSSQER